VKALWRELIVLLANPGRCHRASEIGATTNGKNGDIRHARKIRQFAMDFHQGRFRAPPHPLPETPAIK
jgi:hypothetical protein